MKIKDNWNRLAELTQKRTVDLHLGIREEIESEISYRIDVQNYYSSHGKLPDDYVEVGFLPQGGKSRIK